MSVVDVAVVDKGNVDQLKEKDMVTSPTERPEKDESEISGSRGPLSAHPDTVSVEGSQQNNLEIPSSTEMLANVRVVTSVDNGGERIDTQVEGETTGETNESERSTENSTTQLSGVKIPRDGGNSSQQSETEKLSNSGARPLEDAETRVGRVITESDTSAKSNNRPIGGHATKPGAVAVSGGGQAMHQLEGDVLAKSKSRPTTAMK